MAPERSRSRMLLASPTSRSTARRPRPAQDAADGPVPPAERGERGGRARVDNGHDIVIDLTGTAYTTTAGTSPALTARHRRRWILLGAVATVAVVLAIANFAIGMQWRSVAVAAEDRAVRAAADVAAKQQAVVVAREAREVAELRREAMAKQLAVSEADVAALESRVATLASDKARAEDYGGDTVTHVATDAQMRALQAQLDSCVAQVAALRTTLLVDDPASAALHETATAAEATCEQVGTDAAVLAAGE